MKIKIPDFSEEDLAIPDGENKFPTVEARISKKGIPFTENHFEMLGITRSKDEDLMSIIQDLSNKNQLNLLFSTMEKRDNKFNRIDRERKIDYVLSEAHGNGIMINMIMGDGNIETIVPSFIGKFVEPVKVQNFIMNGGYGTDIIGRIKAHGSDGGYTISVSIPNLICLDMDKVKPKDILIIHRSGLIRSALVKDLRSDVSRRDPDEVPTGVEPGEKGAVHPLPLSEPGEPLKIDPRVPYYHIQGYVRSVKKIKNKITGVKLYHMEVNTGSFDLEMVGCRDHIHGTPKKGKWIEADIWLQGWILQHIPR